MFWRLDVLRAEEMFWRLGGRSSIPGASKNIAWGSGKLQFHSKIVEVIIRGSPIQRCGPICCCHLQSFARVSEDAFHCVGTLGICYQHEIQGQHHGTKKKISLCISSLDGQPDKLAASKLTLLLVVKKNQNVHQKCLKTIISSQYIWCWASCCNIRGELNCILQVCPAFKSVSGINTERFNE